MELTVINDENSFDPTPKLKSSPVPISFISFANYFHHLYNPKSDRCNFCGDQYSKTILFYQAYCKNCLSKYLSHITDNNIYLDVHIVTKNVQCNKHEVARNNIDFCTQTIQEWCENCSDILYFKQVNYRHSYLSEKELEKIRRDCKLCGKLVDNEISNGLIEYRLCSDCYQISSGWIESTLLKKLIQFFIYHGGIIVVVVIIVATH